MSDADELKKLIPDNSVYRDLEIWKKICDGIAQGDGSSVICCGPTGVGKDHTIRAACRRHGRDMRLINPRSPEALLKLYQDNPHGVLVASDIDNSVFGLIWFTTILKSALEGPLPKGEPRLIAYDVIRNFRKPIKCWTSTVILLNRNIMDPAAFNRAIYDSQIRPILRKATPFVMNFDKRALYEYTCYLAVCEAALEKRFRFPLKAQNDALRFMAKYYHRLDDVSIGELAQQAAAYSIRGDIAEATLMHRLRPPPGGKLAAVPVYQIQPRARGSILDPELAAVRNPHERRRIKAQRKQAAAPQPEVIAGKLLALSQGQRDALYGALVVRDKPAAQAILHGTLTDAEIEFWMSGMLRHLSNGGAIPDPIPDDRPALCPECGVAKGHCKHTSRDAACKAAYHAYQASLTATPEPKGSMEAPDAPTEPVGTATEGLEDSQSVASPEPEAPHEAPDASSGHPAPKKRGRKPTIRSAAEQAAYEADKKIKHRDKMRQRRADAKAAKLAKATKKPKRGA